MTLRKKTILTTLAVIGGGMLLTVLFSLFILLSGFNQVEGTFVKRSVERVTDVFNDDKDTLQRTARDWSGWDDTYQFIQDHNQNYIDSNLAINESFINNRLNLMMFVNNDGEVVYEKGFDLEKGDEVPVPTDFNKFLQKNSPLLNHPTPESLVTGLINLSQGTMLVSAQPILKSDRTGPSLGTLIWGRFFNATEVNKLASKTHSTLKIQNLVTTNLASDYSLARSLITPSSPIFIKDLSNSTVSGYAVLKDVFGQNLLIFRVDIARSIYQVGLTTVGYMFWLFVATALLLGLSIYLLINSTIINRLSKLSKKMMELGSTGDFKARLAVEGSDEIANLVSAVNGMLTALEATQNKLVSSFEESKKLQEALEKEKISVDEKIEERTRELTEEHARLEASFNSLNVGLVMTRTDGEIFLINDTAKQVLCQNIDEHGNRAIHSYQQMQATCTMEDIEKKFTGIFDLRREVTKCLEDKRLIEIPSLALGSQFFHVLIAPIVILRNGKIDVLGTVILVEDITETKVIERSKDEFFSIASHELRTPLTAIRGNSALLQEFYLKQFNDKDVAEMVEDIHDSSVRLINIVNDFLDTSRLEQGRIEFQKNSFDMKTLVEDVFKELKTNAESSKTTLKLAPYEEATLVDADADRTKQVLINLVGNAIKFTTAGTVEVGFVKDGVFLKVLVKDTGLGIPPTNQHLLFRKFQQAENNILTRDRTRSTGLGLYISKLLIEAMGGKIILETSEVDKGSTFSFTLPLTKPSKQN